MSVDKNIASDPAEVKKPNLGGPVYDLLESDLVDIKFSSTFLTEDTEIIEVVRPTISLKEKIRKSSELIILFHYIDKKIYIGKPTKISNVILDNELLRLLMEFNKSNPEFLEITEYNGESVPRLVTKYLNPKIIDFKPSDVGEDCTKYYIATVSFTSFTQIIPNQ